jgi:signal transduction histidine kinase
VKSLRRLFIVMLASAAVVPLLTYGVASIYSLRSGVRRTVLDGNTNVAKQVGEQLRRYVSTNVQIFQALAVDIEDTGLSAAQQDLILKNFVLRFPEFRELTMYDVLGRRLASSRVGMAFAHPLGGEARTVMGVAMSPVTIDDDLMPTTVVAMPLEHHGRQTGWLVGQFSIEELWRMAGRVRIGQQGVALIVGAGNELLAHGNPDDRPRVARGENLGTDPVVSALRRAGGTLPVVGEGRTANGRPTLVVGVRVEELDWIVLIEQPRAEAFAIALRQERVLLATIGGALLIVVFVGGFWARAFIRPIDTLIGATQALSAGRLDERVALGSTGEFGRLGTAFNTMADRLVALREDVRKQERNAMFGRVAAGLVHDLSHPFKNVQNNCKLILKMHDDEEYRELFSRTVEREFSTIRRVFEDLRNIAKPMPLEQFPLDLSKLVGETAESTRANAEFAGLTMTVRIASEDVYVSGDMFAIGRVCRNLLVNAFEATPPHGLVTVSTFVAGGLGVIEVTDTGCGIKSERLATLFEDFSTTKRQGLGLGLAISRKIVEQLGGTIGTTSVVGAGTTFRVAFPLVARPTATTEAIRGDEI